MIGPGYNQKFQQSLKGADKPGIRQISLERRANFYDVRILMASKGYMLGHEDVINDRNYTTSVKCQSFEGTVFAIKADEFLAKMNANQLTWDLLLSMTDERDKMTKGKLKKAQKNVRD